MYYTWYIIWYIKGAETWCQTYSYCMLLKKRHSWAEVRLFFKTLPKLYDYHNSHAWKPHRAQWALKQSQMDPNRLRRDLNGSPQHRPWAIWKIGNSDPPAQTLGNWGIQELGNSGMEELGNWGIEIWGGRGLGELGNWGIGELGNWGIGELGNWGIGELGNWGIGELGSWGIGELKN